MITRRRTVARAERASAGHVRDRVRVDNVAWGGGAAGCSRLEQLELQGPGVVTGVRAVEVRDSRVAKLRWTDSYFADTEQMCYNLRSLAQWIFTAVSTEFMSL